jgi:Hint domain-containing protein
MRLALVWAVLLAACGAPAIPTASPSPLAVVELKYRIFEEVGRPWYCDPDFYPIQREDEAVLARQRLPEIQADAEGYRAILEHNGIAVAPATTDQLLAVYRDWKQLRALDLQPAGGDVYGFDLLVQSTGGAKEGARVEGRIDRGGRISIVKREPAGPPNCPICLDEATLIDTPAGPRPITDLRRGDLVWTRSVDGARVAEPVMEVGSVVAPPGHELVRLELADGRVVSVSPGHPTAEGTPIGTLEVGDRLDGSLVVNIARVPYSGRTWDLRPAGSTGIYWADGIALRTTLRHARPPAVR